MNSNKSLEKFKLQDKDTLVIVDRIVNDMIEHTFLL